MPLSFKSRLAKLEHKGQISKEEYQDLLDKLNGHDKQIKIDTVDEILTQLTKTFFDDDNINVLYLKDYLKKLKEEK